MIKLMQNLLGDYKTICCEENGLLKPIRWQYIEGLNDVQENLGFSLANKLKKKHILWGKAQNECESCSTDTKCFSCRCF